MYADAESHLSDQCALMRRLIKAHGPCQLDPQGKRQPYESLMRAIAHQQLHANAAEAILGRVIALYPGKFPQPEDILATDDAKLRACGLSFSKIAAFRDIAQHTLSGTVPTRAKIAKLEDEEIIVRLTQIRGVGRWTVEMLLIFQLGRPDVLPVDDYGIRNGFRIIKKLDALPKPKELLAYGARWQPHRTVASWYLWRAADAAKA